MSECDVCIGGCDDPMEMISESTPTCRLPFKCCECRREIAKGEKYEKMVGRYDGQFLTYRTCLLCVEIRTIFCCGEGWMFESLWDDMREYAFERLTTASPCFTKLSAKAKAFVLERWQEWKGV